MKILFISPFTPPAIDGVGEYTFHLADQLRKQGNDVRILTGLGQTPSAEWIYPCLSFPDTSNLSDLLKKLGWKPEWISFQYVPQLYGKYGLSNSLGNFLRELRKITGAKISITFHEHGTDWKKGFKNKLLSLLLRLQTRTLLKNADSAVTTCLRYQEALQAFAPDLFIETIPVGAGILPAPYTEDDLQTLRAHYQLDSSKGIGIFGRISSFRSFDLFIPILKRIHDEKIAAKLFILGAAGASSPRLLESFQKRLKQECLEEDVIMPGAMNPRDLSLHLRLFDLYLFPQEDGLSTRNTTILSALAHGLKILSYEPLEGNFSGFPIPPYTQFIKRGNKQEFVSAAIAQLKLSIKNVDPQKEIRGYFERFFSWEILADHFLKHLTEIH